MYEDINPLFLRIALLTKDNENFKTEFLLNKTYNKETLYDPLLIY